MEINVKQKNNYYGFLSKNYEMIKIRLRNEHDHQQMFVFK